MWKKKKRQDLQAGGGDSQAGGGATHAGGRATHGGGRSYARWKLPLTSLLRGRRWQRWSLRQRCWSHRQRRWRCPGFDRVSGSGGVAGGSTGGLTVGASSEEDSLEGAPVPVALEAAPPSEVSGAPSPALKAASTDLALALEVAAAPVEAAVAVEAAATRVTMSSQVAWAGTQGAVRVLMAAAGSSVVVLWHGC